MKKLKIQLVGKITGEDYQQTKIKFCQAVTTIQGRYITRNVANPMALCRQNWSWVRCMVVCLFNIIFKVNTIAVLPDWVDSKGAKIEVVTAILFNKKIIRV